jgi:hypothetical protein
LPSRRRSPEQDADREADSQARKAAAYENSRLTHAQEDTRIDGVSPRSSRLRNLFV